MSARRRPPSAAVARPTPSREPTGVVLTFELAGRDYALDLAHVDGVVECGAVRRVPGAPPAVVGLVEWRGHVLTLLDLARLLDRPVFGGPPTVIRLAPPLEHTALLLRAPLQLTGPEEGNVAAGGRRLLDPRALVRPAGRGDSRRA